MRLSRFRFPLLGLAIAILIFATLAGLMRLGWKVPTINAGWMAAHGPLMVSGFLGSLISVERAVALGKRWMYAGPALAGLGGIVLLAGLPIKAAQILMILGSLGLIVIFGTILKQHFAIYTATMALGATAWFVGNVIWLVGGRIPQAVPWWAGFLILTVAGERLEFGAARELSPLGAGVVCWGRRTARGRMGGFVSEF